MTAGLQGRDLMVAAGGRCLLEGVNIDVRPGRLTALIGPNGAGKSTLLKALCGDIAPQSGTVTLNGRPLSSWGAQDRALQRAVLPQTPELAFSFRAWDIVELGRHPHRHYATGAQDRAAVLGAMTMTNTSAFARRDCGTLSGGEMHRTHFARTLAQVWAPLPDGRARLLLLDEPTASLDLFHQHAILARACAVARAGAGVLAVLHDLNLAAAYADTLVMLAHGRVEAAGPPEEVLNGERIARIWQVHCDVEKDREGTLWIRVRHSIDNEFDPPRCGHDQNCSFRFAI